MSNFLSNHMPDLHMLLWVIYMEIHFLSSNQSEGRVTALKLCFLQICKCDGYAQEKYDLIFQVT